MHYLLQGWVAETLRRLNRRWSRSLELGCGTGDGGVLLRPYTSYLVGVDVDPAAVEEAQKRGVYDELHVRDARDWPLQGFDSLFMFEMIEHIPKEDGYRLLEKCGNLTTMLSTPWWMERK